MFQIDYSEKSQKNGLRRALQEMKAALASRVEQRPDLRAQLCREAARSFDWLAENRAPAAKHVSFHNEKEWRLLRWRSEGHAEVDVRVAGERLVPYIPVKMSDGGKLPITCIGIGPGHADPAVRSAVDALLRTTGYDVQVYSADTPFRRI